MLLPVCSMTTMHSLLLEVMQESPCENEAVSLDNIVRVREQPALLSILV
jgi:hypothetical protein